MPKHHFYSLDFIFLYICTSLIGWMSYSYYIQVHTDNAYATTTRVRVGYEVRAYESESLVGAEVFTETHSDIWRSARNLKNSMAQKDIEVLPYPFLVKENADGRKYIYFIPTSNSVDAEGFDVITSPKNTAFLEFTWYPIESYVQKTYSKIVNSLIDDEKNYNKSELWIEVRSPWYAIPFMMHNGVFVELIK